MEQVATAERTYPKRWVAAVVMIGAVLMDMIDISIVNVALPTIGTDLGASGTELEWIVSAYMLAFAALLIIAGSLGDLLGRRRFFLVGIGCFGAASLAAGLAMTPGQLIAARVVQGAGAAAMVPQLLATFRTIFTGPERGKAFGMYGAILGFASAFGLILGGVLTSADLFGSSWRAIFFVNVPIATVALLATVRFVPETRDRSAGRPDVLGAALLFAALVAVAYPLFEGRSLGWPTWTWLLLGGGVGGLVALALIERGRQQAGFAPVLQAPLLRIPAFTAGLVVTLAFGAGLQGFFLTFALWIQLGQGFSPLAAGLTTVAFSVGSFMLAPVAVGLAQRFGRLVLSGGALLLATGVAAVGVGADQVGDGTDPWPIVPGLVVAGAGLSLLIIPLVNVVLAAVPRQVAGGASGQFSTAQQLGGALGVAVVGSMFFARLDDGQPFTASFTAALPLITALFVLAAVLSLALPRTAVSEEDAI